MISAIKEPRYIKLPRQRKIRLSNEILDFFIYLSVVDK